MALVGVGEGSNVTVVGCRRDRREIFVRKHSGEGRIAPSFLTSIAWRHSKTCQGLIRWTLETEDLKEKVDYSVRVTTVWTLET